MLPQHCITYNDVFLLIIKYYIGDSQNTTKHLFATAGIQDSNNYMFRPFLLAIIRLYIPSFKSMYNMPTIVHNLETRNIQPDDGQ